MDRRRFILVAGGFSATILSGCVDNGETVKNPTNGTKTKVTETVVSETETQTKNTKTDAPPDHTDLSDKPSYDIPIFAQNFSDATEELTVLVTHVDSEEAVFEDTVTLKPDEEYEVFHFEEIEEDYGGVESFKISTSLSNGNMDEETIGTNECYGDARIDIEEGGDLQVYYSIC